jgi:hypothetical protein
MSEQNEFSEKKEDMNDLNNLLSQTGMDKKTQKQSVVEGKLSQMLLAQEQFVNNQLKRVNEVSFIEYNVEILE